MNFTRNLIYCLFPILMGSFPAFSMAPTPPNFQTSFQQQYQNEFDRLTGVRDTASSGVAEALQEEQLAQADLDAHIALLNPYATVPMQPRNERIADLERQLAALMAGVEPADYPEPEEPEEAINFDNHAEHAEVQMDELTQTPLAIIREPLIGAQRGKKKFCDINFRRKAKALMKLKSDYPKHGSCIQNILGSSDLDLTSESSAVGKCQEQWDAHSFSFVRKLLGHASLGVQGCLGEVPVHLMLRPVISSKEDDGSTDRKDVDAFYNANWLLSSIGVPKVNYPTRIWYPIDNLSQNEPVDEDFDAYYAKVVNYNRVSGVLATSKSVSLCKEKMEKNSSGENKWMFEKHISPIHYFYRKAPNLMTKNQYTQNIMARRDLCRGLLPAQKLLVGYDANGLLTFNFLEVKELKFAGYESELAAQ